MTFAEKVIQFNKHLKYTGAALPDRVQIMNPFEDAVVQKNAASFYRKFYNDNNKRHLILGINPGRFGAGLTGIPFTDPKRLVNECGIPYKGAVTHEPSSVFVYDMIKAYGGVEKFYAKFYINAVCPLGFTTIGKNDKAINYNYYDSKELIAATHPFIVKSLQRQFSFGVPTDIVFCFGTGKNEQFLRKLNEEFHFFKKLIALEHPRYVMQYKSREKNSYIDKYLAAFGK